MDTRCTILIPSPDTNRELLRLFVLMKSRFWRDCSLSTFVATQTENWASYGNDINYLYTGENSSWGERMHEALKKIQTPYILFLCDDFFISKNIDNERFDYILEKLIKRNAKFCRFFPPAHNSDIAPDLWEVLPIPKNVPYGINIGGGIYSRDYLMDLIGDGTIDGWTIENELNKQCANYNKDDYYEDCFWISGNFLGIIHGVSKGKWFPSAKRKIKKLGYKVDDSMLTMSRLQEIKLSMVSKIGKRLTPRMRKILKQNFKFLKFTTSF
jgi:hypothetical protein